MQETAKREKTKKKKHPVIILLLILLAAAAACYWFFLRTQSGFDLRETAYQANYPSMQTNAMGTNLIGNLPENAQAGGFMAGQDDWIYFANFADNASLYMCHEGGGKMVKITDFPVANINVMADTLVFTSLEQCVAKRPDGLYTVKFDFVNELLSGLKYASHVQYGGKLYAINGLRFGGALDLTVIDSENIYFSPVLTESGLYAVCSQEKAAKIVDAKTVSKAIAPAPMALGLFKQKTAKSTEPFDGHNLSDEPPARFVRFSGEPSAIAEKMSLTVSPVGQPGERMIKQFVRGGTMYAEMCAYGDTRSGGRILRIDLETLQPIDSMPGHDLYKRGESFVFISGDDGFIYEIGPDGGRINPISVMPVSDMTMNQAGKITASLFNGSYIVLSPDKMYGPVENVFERVLRGKNYAHRQNGWYNYVNPNLQLLRSLPAPGFFMANDKYYRVGPDGVWMLANEPVEWLNRTPSLDALAPGKSFLPVLDFAPPWVNENDTITAPADETDEDEIVVDNRLDATLEPHYALEATIMLMTQNASVKDKYSAASLENLKKYYGGSIDLNVAIDAGAARLEEYLSAQMGVSPGRQELSDLLHDWFMAAKFSVGDSEITGDTAKTKMSVSNIIDSKALSAALENEIAKRAAKSPMIVLWSKERQMEWALAIFMEIAKNPKEYGAIGAEPVNVNIGMRNIPGVGWVVENPGDMINLLAVQ